MNARERVLAILLGCVIILGGAGFFGYQFVYVPWAKRNRDLANLKTDYTKKQNRITEIEGHRAELARWRMLSLPAEPDVARREYEKYLNEMLSRHRFAAGFSIAAKAGDKQAAAGAAKNKEPIYQKLTFTVSGDATMPHLVAALEEFYRTGLLHEIKSLSIQRQLTNTDPAKANDLSIRMNIEALIVTGADKRSYVLPNIDRRLLAVDLAAALQHGPTGLGLVLWAAGPTGPAGPGLLAGGRRGTAPSDAAVENVFVEPPRRYESIASKNVFLGRPPAELDELGPPEWMAPRFVHLTGITTNNIGKTTGSLFDASTNRWSRLRATSGFDQFVFVKDGNKKGVLRGAVVKIEDRDIIFRAEIAAEDSPDNPARTREGGFYRLDKKQHDKLVADKIVTAEEAACVYRVERSYWESLLKSLVIRERDSTSFRIQLEKDSDKPAEDEDQGNSVEVLRGKVIQSEGAELLIHVESRYYAIHLGQSLADALKKPLPREQVKGLKLVTN